MARPASDTKSMGVEEMSAKDRAEVLRLVKQHGTGGTSWGGVTGNLSNQVDLQAVLNAKAATSHGHVVSDTAGLQAALDAKAASVHTHVQASVTNLVTDLAGKAAAVHSHPQSEVTNLVTDLAGKAASTHSHPQSEVTNLVSDLSGKAAVSHSHAQSDVTNLVSDLSGKQVTLVSGTNIKTINGASVLGSGDLVVGGGGGGGINTLKKTANQTINSGAGVFTDITGLTFPVVSGVDYAFDFYITFQSAALTTGWRAGVNCPAGTLDFWAGSDVIANGAAGVATHTERHNTVRDDMTLLTATITANVDLTVRIRGRYLCTANGTLAARFANELAANTQVVVQKGSWGLWF